MAARQRFNFKLGWVFKNPVLTIGGHLDKPQIRVLLVDDFYPFRRYLSSTLRKRADVRVIGEAADGLEAVKQVKQLVPDLVLLDIGLPRQNGIDAARQIRTVCPNTKIIFVSQESSRELVEEALALGAKGYLVKSALAMELMARLTLSLVANGLSAGNVKSTTASHPAKPVHRFWSALKFFVSDV